MTAGECFQLRMMVSPVTRFSRPPARYTQFPIPAIPLNASPAGAGSSMVFHLPVVPEKM